MRYEPTIMPALATHASTPRHLKLQNEVMSHKPVCYAFSITPWKGPWMNRQQLLSRLARRGWPIAYSTGALNIWERNSAAWRTAPLLSRLEHVDDVRLDVAGRVLPTWPSHRSYSDWVIRQHSTSLRRRVGTPPMSNAIAYIFWPEFFPYARALGCRYLVYHAVDTHTFTPGWTRELETLEYEAVERADLVIGTTEHALERLPAGGSAPRYVLPNGADFSTFARGPEQPCPHDLATIPHPRISYTGRLNRKVDFNLIAAIAHARPDWHWVITGPVTENMDDPAYDARLAADYATCRRLPNVHFLGSKSVAELPAYMGHSDVNVMCYRNDNGGWWSTGYPLKLHEYLACGKPVVSTPLATVRPFRHVIDLANDTQEWMQAIERSLRSGGVGTLEQRRDVARNNSWDMRVDQLDAWLTEMIRRKP